MLDEYSTIVSYYMVVIILLRVQRIMWATCRVSPTEIWLENPI